MSDPSIVKLKPAHYERADCHIKRAEFKRKGGEFEVKGRFFFITQKGGFLAPLSVRYTYPL